MDNVEINSFCEVLKMAKITLVADTKDYINKTTNTIDGIIFRLNKLKEVKK